jgi:hypothetical protein
MMLLIIIQYSGFELLELLMIYGERKHGELPELEGAMEYKYF